MEKLEKYLENNDKQRNQGKNNWQQHGDDNMTTIHILSHDVLKFLRIKFKGQIIKLPNPNEMQRKSKLSE